MKFRESPLSAFVGSSFVSSRSFASLPFGAQRRTFQLIVAVLALPIAAMPAAPASGEVPQTTGIVEGRVFNAASGVALENARITLSPGGLTAYSDATGEFRVTGVPSGQVRVSASYVGMAPKTDVVA